MRKISQRSIAFVSLLCLILWYVYEDPARESLLRGSDPQFRNSISRNLAEVSSSGEAVSILLIFVCIICAGLASGLTQVRLQSLLHFSDLLFLYF